MSNSSIAPTAEGYPKNVVPCRAITGFWLLALLAFIFSLFISACGLDIEDPTQPSAPVWVQKSLPEEWPERGIDASELGGIYLEWESNPARENIIAYHIYRAQYFALNDSLGDFEMLSMIDMEIAHSLDFIDNSATQSFFYFYKLKAMDSSENLSAYSDSVGYSLLQPVISNLMIPNGLDETLEPDRALQWKYNYSEIMELYVITILNARDQFVLRSEYVPSTYIYGGTEYFIIPDSIIMLAGEIYKWRVETGAYYDSNIETAGSESSWASFLYIGS